MLGKAHAVSISKSFQYKLTDAFKKRKISRHDSEIQEFICEMEPLKCFLLFFSSVN